MSYVYEENQDNQLHEQEVEEDGVETDVLVSRSFPVRPPFYHYSLLEFKIQLKVKYNICLAGQEQKRIETSCIITEKIKDYYKSTDKR